MATRGRLPSSVPRFPTCVAGYHRNMAANDPLTPATGSERPSERHSGGMLLVAGAALLGLVLARVIDWRSHAHPR